MKKGLLILGTTLVVLFLAISAGCSTFSGSSADTSAASNSQQSTGIWVTGVGKVTVIPDVAVVSMGVQAQAATVADAQKQASTAMAAVMAALNKRANTSLWKVRPRIKLNSRIGASKARRRLSNIFQRSITERDNPYRPGWKKKGRSCQSPRIQRRWRMTWMM